MDAVRSSWPIADSSGILLFYTALNPGNRNFLNYLSIEQSSLNISSFTFLHDG
jgi:hypothetical protein